MFIQFIVSMIATLSFAVLFCAPKSELLFCGLTGAIGWIVYLICLQFDTGTVIANMIATLALTVFSRVVAALRKNPVTVYLIAGIFPLVPGAGIYYTSYYFIMNNMSEFSRYGMETIKVAGAYTIHGESTSDNAIPTPPQIAPTRLPKNAAAKNIGTLPK